MTLMCIERSQSPTHKGGFLQGGKSPVSSNLNHQNANHHHHHRRNSCSPPLSKHHQDNNNKSSSGNKLERSASVQSPSSGNNSSRYKTELCRPFEENGTCKYGDKCQFAHGVKELRSMARHPKYKTELCRTFHSTGLCPYGPRCHFIHNSEQAKKSLLTNLAVAPRPKQQPLGSTGDMSPSSSHSGTPTGMRSFEDLYSSEMQLASNGPFAAYSSHDLANILNSLNQGFGGDVCYGGGSDACDSASVFSGDGGTSGDAVLDNYSYQGGPVLDLYQTAPTTPIDGNGGFFRLPIFDLFHK